MARAPRANQTELPWWCKPLGAVFAVVGAVLIFMNAAEENDLAGKSVPQWVSAVFIGVGVTLWISARKRTEPDD